MSPIRTPKLLTLLMVMSMAVGLNAAGTASATGSGCQIWRSYGFTAESNDPAAAGAVGHANPWDVDEGSQSFTLTVTEKQARYMREAEAGGCTVWIKVLTRGTTGTLGMGTAEFDGTASISGSGAGGSITDSGSHPLSECPNTLICQENSEYWFGVDAVDGGASFTITSSATATAIAGGFTTIDQATATWEVRHPALVIPIP